MGDYKAKLAGLPAAPFYECGDPDELSYESPEEAVIGYLDNGWSNDRSIRDQIAAEGTITVTAYRHIGVEERFYRETAVDIAERMRRLFDDDYGGTEPNQTSEGALDRKRPEIEAFVRKLFADIKPWRCDAAGSVELDADEVLALVADHEPGWLEVP